MGARMVLALKYYKGVFMEEIIPIGKITKYGFIILLILAFLIPGSSLWMDYVEHRFFGQVQTLDDGWTWNGESVASMLEYAGQADEDNEITLTRALTEDVVLEGGGAILYRSTQQTLSAYVGDELIYEYNPLTSQPFGHLAPSKWHYISLSAEDVGEELTLVTHCPLSQFASGMQTIRSGTESSLHSFVFQSYLPVFLSNVFLISAGLLLFVVTLFPEETRWIRLAGSFTIAMGLWGIGESKFIDFLFLGNYFWYILTFEAVLFGIYLYTVFICTFIKRHIKRTDFWIEKVALGNIFFQNAMYFWGIFEFMEMLIFSHILVGIIAIINVYYTFHYRNSWLMSKESVHKFICVQGIFLLSVVVEIVEYLMGDFAHTGFVFRIGISVYIVAVVGLSVGAMLQQMDKAHSLAEELLEYRVSIARSQIKPHFIFNTLTSIRTLIKIDQEKAYQLVGMFSKYLRVNMNSFESKELIPLSEELGHIRTYVEIEKVRFGAEKIAVVYDIRSEDFLVPSLSIQPIVENAIKHGICKKKGGGVVTIRSHETKKEYILEVVDTGIGFDVDLVLKKGVVTDSIGLANVHFRLQTLMDANISITSEIGKGTRVYITIPKGVSQ